jgi:hypothetical protein
MSRFPLGRSATASVACRPAGAPAGPAASAPTSLNAHSDRGRGVSRRAFLGGVGVASTLLLAGCSGRGSGRADATSTHVAERVSVTGMSSTKISVLGQAVTVHGSGLNHVTKVRFGTGSASTTVAVTSASASKVVVQAPAAANYQPASVDVTLLDSKGGTVAHEASALDYVVTPGAGAQMQYALEYWQNYNTAVYGDLNPVGGDCANFVSQTLLARGWQMNDDWYNHDAAADWSPAWGYVPAMDDYFSANAGSLGLQQLGFDQASRADVALGDVAVFFWNGDTSADHTEVVDKIEKVNGQYKISLASHNDDFAFRDLDETITVAHPNSSGHFWHLTA